MNAAWTDRHEGWYSDVDYTANIWSKYRIHLNATPLLNTTTHLSRSNKTPVKLEGKQGQYKEVDTIHLKYSQRPEILKDICLAQFATSYTYIRKENIPKQTKWKDSASEEKGNLKYDRCL